MVGNARAKGARRGMFAAVLLASAAAGPLAMTMAAPARAQDAAERSFDIPAQALPQALVLFAGQSDYQVATDGAEVQGLTSGAVSGAMPPLQALSQLLAGTGLTFRIQGDVVTLEPAPQAAAGAIQLGAVQVQGEAAPNYAIVDPGRTEGSPDYVAPAASSSFGMPLTLRETPQTVVVVPQAAIRDFNLTTVREVLEFTPGVFIRPERSQDYYDFQSRGYDMQIQFDGVPSPNGMGGRGRSITPDTAIVDRVEILQGASGLMSGVGAPGGIVNIFRKMPTSTAFAELEARVDSWGGWRGVADISGPLSANGFGGRLVAVMEERGSYIDYVSGKHAVLYGVLEHRFGDDTTVAVGATFDTIFDYSPGSHYGFPTQVNGELYPNIPRERNWGATWSNLEETTLSPFLRVQHQISEQWSIQGMLSYEDFETRSLQGLPGRIRTVADWPNLMFGAQSENWYAKSYSLDIGVEGEFTLLQREHQLMFGFNGSQREIGGDGGGSSAAPLVMNYDPATWDARQAPDPYSGGWNEYGDWSGQRDNIGAYAGARLNLIDGVHALVGGRVNWYEQSWDGVPDTESTGVLTPYTALTWDIVETLSVYASYTEIFEPHTLTVRDRNNEVLDPVTGENKEVGVKLSLFGDRLLAQGALYSLNQVNLAEPDFAGEFPGVCGGLLPDPCYHPSGEVQAEGWDISVSGEIAPGFRVLGGYGRVENEGSWFAPDRDVGSLGASYTAPDDRWNVGVTVRYQSSWEETAEPYFAPGAGLDYTYGFDGHTVVGLNARYNLTDTLSVSGEVSNLFDEEYLTQRDWPSNGSVWGDPRRATLTLRARF